MFEIPMSVYFEERT